MPKRVGVVLGALLGVTLAAPVWCQEEAARTDEGQAASSAVPEAQPAPRRMIRVLQDPYDLASFYRSSQDPWGGPRHVPGDPAYALASFYRSDRSGPIMPPWAAFWAGGYGARPSGYLGYRQSIGENGELFLAVPFLAPVGPLTGAFFGY
jgi:hypothetical protein